MRAAGSQLGLVRQLFERELLIELVQRKCLGVDVKIGQQAPARIDRVLDVPRRPVKALVVIWRHACWRLGTVNLL